MMHYFVGDLGHLFVITSFIAAIASAFSYFRSTGAASLDLKDQWRKNGAVAFYVHATAVLGICVTLFIIIYNHYFEYHYAYSHSDRNLPLHYLISTFWNGQEGSFLLWMFWQAALGLVLIFTNRFWEAPVMTVFGLVQAFLASMILGVVIPGLDFRIGSSPFILLREVMQNAPIFVSNPEFIPNDGTGLNPLLQNYWMVIHPPTLFLGFASTLVPFSFCLAGLWLKKYREWVRPALPWALFGGAVLGLGILMGGYWAYETLNFGGYWNWDPVENGIYVPWLILVASIHTMITYKNSETALKASIILVIAVFVLVLYATFLTRSGVLGDSSVHSFTDLGLSGQLLVYLGFFLFGAIILSIVRWKEIPSSDKEVSTYSREFWIFVGTLVICLMGFQVLLPTSIPAWNKFVGFLGFSSNMAPPADQIYFYTKFQLWFAVAIALLSAVGQFFWWKKMDVRQLGKELLMPFIITLVAFVVILQVMVSFYSSEAINARYLIILFSALFTVIANGKILLSLLKSSPGLSGGAVAHIGVGMMLIGMMFSSGYSKVVSLNNTGLLYSREASEEYNRENLLLFINEPRTMAGYKIEFKGERLEPRWKSGYLNPNDVEFIEDPYRVVAKRDIQYNGRKLFNAKDTIEIFPENKYYEVQLVSQGGGKHTLYPRIQDNPTMGVAASPDIKRDLSKDLYAHIVDLNDPEKAEWSKTEEIKVAALQEFFANDYVAVLEKVERIFSIGNTKLDSADVAVKALIRVKGEYEEYLAEPIFIIRNRMVGRIPDEIKDLGVRLTLMNIHPETGQFSIGIDTRQKDWIVLKAFEKPLINVLWIGTLVLMIGFGIAIVRRSREFKKMKEKGLE
ncbi:cytochrome c biogenesis protein CcsA [Fulvivirgaceae bacterium PWU4]|uniref:Cytochrome c biogenesis protein CcsA n=1 Tax=Chryseosolibacter histidini TaxID=2782349 RepID=A0AAP2GSS6_9BACT|nr:cytochrome c biogenesis protein CcsA [Chryseosolibacter histidini]MBT1700897.1 cytochrome c biogenesis protein CcsA [Chryseosolibacter histidini]